MTLSSLQREYETQVIGTKILGEIHRACASAARRYPPSIYARAPAWDNDSVDDLVQDVTAVRLLGERQLAYLFDMARDIDSWRALMARQVTITLARRRVRTVVDNLLDRSRTTLRHSETIGISTELGQEVFRGAEAGSPYRPMSDDEVRKLAEQARIVPRRLAGRSDRAPAVYSARNLEALLQIVIRGSPLGFTVRDLGRILEFVLTDWVVAVLEHGEDDLQLPAADLAPDQLMEIRETAYDLASGLSNEESEILRGRLAGLRDIDVANHLGISRPTLGKRRNALFDRIRTAASNLDGQAQDALMDEIALNTLERHPRDERQT